MNNQELTQEHHLNHDNKPAGGYTEGVGVHIRWQDGPLGRGEDRLAPNGAFVETVIRAAKDRIEHYQSTEFASDYNARAISHLDDALEELCQRTADREARGVEGTHVA